MRRTLSVLALLLLAPCAWAELRIVGQLKVEPYRLVQLAADGVPEGARLLWDVTPEESIDVVEFPTKVIFAAPPGTYKVKLRSFPLKDGPIETARATVVIGVPPPPVPPVPPAPPVPPPEPAPIAQPGLRVLIVYETAELSKMPAEQRNVLYSKTVRDYLNSKCPAGADGRTREWRIWDKDVATDGESKLWQDAMSRPKRATPWILISNSPKGGFEGPLPKTVDETLALIKRYGGE